MSAEYLREVVKARASIYGTLLDAYLLGIAHEDAVRRAWLAYEAAVAQLEAIEMQSYLEAVEWN